MKSFTAAALVASCAAAAVASPILSERNNDGKKYDGHDGKKATSAGGKGPNPDVPGDGGNGLTVTVIDPTGNNTIDNPQYRAITDFDYASFNLGLYQEWIELDLFHYGLARFSVEEFEEAGITADQRYLLQFMADQETGHAQLLTNILGPGAAKQCTYNYSGRFDTVREYVDFNQQLTRWGESGVWGFLSKLNSKPSAQLLAQSIATEARQQMIFRQFTGGPAMDVYFETGIPQAWQWTLLAPLIQSCPPENPRIGWSNYPTLRVDNQNPLRYDGSKSAVSTNITQPLAGPGKTIYYSWDKAGEMVGPDDSYKTVAPGGSTPKYALFQQSYNISYAPITLTSETSGYAVIPEAVIFDTDISYTGTAFNGTGLTALVNDNPFLTPYNSTKILPHMVAGPAIIQFG